MSGWAVWSVVEQCAKEISIERFGAHDLRRTCAKLCRKNGGNIEQIKFLLGHSSIQTTERYLGVFHIVEVLKYCLAGMKLFSSPRATCKTLQSLLDGRSQFYGKHGIIVSLVHIHDYAAAYFAFEYSRRQGHQL